MDRYVFEQGLGRASVMYLPVILFFCFSLPLISATNELYAGYKIYNVRFTTEQQQEQVELLKNDRIDFLRSPSFKNDVTGRALVPASQMDWFEEKLREIGVSKDIYVEDVYDYLKERDTTSRNDISKNFDFDGYYRYDQILEYLNALEESNSNIEIVEYGRTLQNRPLVYIKASRITTTDKPIVIAEAGINPREWITIPAAVNVINKLFETSESRFLDNFDWIVIPVVNPDGYEYTHTDLRFWEKTLTTSSHLGFICPGTNVNRNFDIDWLVSGSSSSPCSHLYGGVEAFSEIESQMIRSLLEEYGNRIKLYISIQNNGPYVTYPWQYERAASGMFRQHHFLAQDMIKAVDPEFRTGVGSIVLDDRASGTSSDYAQRNGVLYSFNVNIKQSDDTVIVPESEIMNAANGVWRAISVAADELA